VRGVSRWRADFQFTTSVAPSSQRNGKIAMENKEKSIIEKSIIIPIAILEFQPKDTAN